MKRNKIDVRMSDEELAQLDDWCERQGLSMTRSAAIRHAIMLLMSYSIRIREEASK